ncbi:MAG: DUF4124 domain-containing protein [Burkholderiaceae bacterium]|nr:DUF4124 domain-containing protein [Burkholderiaceae bacterium]
MRALLLLLLGLCTAAVCGAAPISRCEFADGRVVYSDEACPSGAQRVRTVDEKPPVEVLKGPVNQHGQSAQSSGSVRRSEGEAGSEGPDPEAAARSNKLKVAECDDLVRKVEYAQHDLSAASESERASAELSLRRLQAEHESKCGLKR